LFVPGAETITTVVEAVVVVWAVVAGVRLVTRVSAAATVGAVRKGVSGTGAGGYVSLDLDYFL
jgi:hypothetical protein